MDKGERGCPGPTWG